MTIVPNAFAPVGFRLVATAAVAALGAALTACSVAPPAEQAKTIPASPTQVHAGSVWVADEAGDSLTIIDAEANSVVATLAGLKEPHNVQVGRDGATVFAVSGSSNLVVAIDARTYAVQAVARTGSAPAHVIDAPNGKVYVTNSDDGTVSVYRRPGLQPTSLITLGGMPHGLRPAAGGSVIVVAKSMAGALDLIDPATDTSFGRVHVGTGPAQVAVAADGRYAYAGITDPPSVVKVDLTARAVIGTAYVPAPPVQLYLAPDESTVLSADQGTMESPGHTVSLIDTRAMTVRGTVTTGSGPHGVVIDTAGTRAWVTNTYDNAVSVIDLLTHSVVATIQTGTAPSGISYSPHRATATNTPTTTLEIPAPSASTGEPSPHQHGH